MSTTRSPEEDKVAHFPKAGLDFTLGFNKQVNRQTYQGTWARSTPIALNVRAFDTTNTFRGGSRAGLSRFINVPVGGSRYLIQGLDTITWTGGSPVQTSQSGRVVTAVAVRLGSVYIANAGATSWSATTNTTSKSPPLIPTGVVFSAENAAGLWFADGTNYAVYDPAVNTVKPWIATAGTLPVDSSGNTPRLIETWRGRTVVSGLLLDQQNWFMSAVGDPRDFDYGASPPTATMAVAGNNSTLGKIGDMVTTIIPYSDDLLIFGGDHTIWSMKGDPMDGGRLDLVTSTVGMAWGRPWCMSPTGTIYFVSNKMGVFRMVPGSQPERVSQSVEYPFQQVNTGTSSIRLAWDDTFQGVHVFITTLSRPAADVHWFYCERSGGWFNQSFGNNDYNPLALCVFDGNLPDDRQLLIGSWDGIVRVVDPTALKDDLTNITSEVIIGPFLTNTFDDLNSIDIQAILGETSGNVTYGMLWGRTAEEALEATPRAVGTWRPGRSNTSPLNVAGHALYLRITSTDPWAMEAVRIKLRNTGLIRRRSGTRTA